MWFGTEDGLNRYDGKNFRIFRPDPRDANSLSYRWIEHIYEDDSGVLWFGSRGGLTRFDPQKEQFIQYRFSQNDLKGISNDTITTILQDQQGKYLWIGTLGGLNRIDLTTPEQISPVDYQGEMYGLSSRINLIVPDEFGNLWIGTNSGLYVYDLNSEEFKKISPVDGSLDNLKILSLVFDAPQLWVGTDIGLLDYSPDENSYSAHPLFDAENEQNYPSTIQNLLLDKDNNLWVLSMSGLFKMNNQTRQFSPVIESVDATHSLSIKTEKPFLQDVQGSIWYGTFSSGLYKINPQTGKIYHYVHSAADQTSLSENSINCIYEDRSGVLWFGTFGAGISIYYPQSHIFELIRHDPLDENSVSSNFIWSVLEDRDGSVWIGTNDRGLNRFNPSTGLFTFYDHQEGDPGSLSNSSVREIFQDSKGTIWVGTDGGGLSRFISSSGQFEHFQFDPNDTNSLSNNSVRVFTEDRFGNLWIGTRGGLNRFNPESRMFKRYLHSSDVPTSISNDFVYSCIYEDNDGYLWIGTYGGGLNKMDPINETFQSFLSNPNVPGSISDNVVFSVYQDPSGMFWIGTNDGLNRYDPEQDIFMRFGIDEGLPNEVIYGILPDQDNNLWMSTNLGISRFNISTYGIKNFDMNDGLQSNEFNGGAYHRGSEGTLYFAGVYGLNIINPDVLVPAENTSEVVISKLEVLGREVAVLPSSKQNLATANNRIIIDEVGNFYTPYEISYTEEVILQYRYRFFSIEFVALNNPLPVNMRYAYRLDDIEKDWNYSGERNYVSYANMKPGTYYFTVKAENPDGLWSVSESSLKIIITPPFWRTWWFIILEVIAALIVIVYIYSLLLKARTNKILKIQNEEIQIANRKLAESEKNLRNLNATKDKFFSIVSHDLKNPFGSLLSITDLLVQNFNTSEESEKISGIEKIQNSMKQLYSLLENLLTWSRSQSGRIQFEPFRFNLSNVLQVNVNLHRNFAEKKKIQLIYHFKEDVMAYGDREMINTVVRNLINNAIKFTEEGKQIELSVIEEAQVITVKVIDQGVGISEADIQKLFRIDVKFKSRGTSGEKGTGLGLILCREFVEKNGGKMIVKSELGKGSDFGFTIPKSQDNL